MYSVPPTVAESRTLPTPPMDDPAPSPVPVPVPVPSQALVRRQRAVPTGARPGGHQADTKRRRGQYDPQVWEDHKESIRRLYIEQGKPLREVVEAMARTHGFHATEKMFKIRIKQWGFGKNNTRRDVSQMLKARFVREAMGKRSEFIRNGKTVDIDDYLRRKGLTEYDVVDLESSPVSVEDALRIVRCRTPPEPERLSLPERLRQQEGWVLAIRRALMFWASDPREHDQDYWVTRDYSFIKDLKDAQALAQQGDTGQAIVALQGVLQTKLRSIDQVDSAGGLWLLLIPATWANTPIIATTLFKYVALLLFCLAVGRC